MKAFISRRDFLKAAGIPAAAAALAGCSSSGGSASGSSAGGKTIKIGVFEPASGDNGAGGKQEVLGVEYANSLAPTVEIGGETYNVELVEVDNQSSTDKAVTAAQELVSKKVSIVLGSYGSGVSIAAAPTFQSASIPAIGCSCTNPAVTEANPYYFRVCFLDPFQGSVMANFAKDEFSAANAYVLSMLGEDYGSGLATYFVNAFEDLGGTVTSEQFPEGTSDFSAYIQNAINAGADVIFAPCATTYAAQIITQAASAGFDKPITAGDTWESSVILDAQKGTSVQVYCSTFFDENDDSGAAKEFVTGFKEWLNADSQKLTNNGGYTIELGEKLYKNLKKISTTDDFGRPATKWTWKSESVGTYADAADLSYTKAVKAGDIYKDLNLSDTVAAKNVTVWVNGEQVSAASLDIKKGSETKIGAKLYDANNGTNGNGVLTEVFYDDGDNSVIITMVNTYVGQISKSVAATSKKDAYVVIDTLGAGPVGGTLEFETEAKIDDDTYVLYTYAKGDADAVKSVAVAESVSGTVTKVVNNAADDDNKKLTVAGTEYKMSANSHVDGGALTNVAVKNDYVVYLDSYGYAIYVEEDEVLSTDYALLLATQNKDKFSENKAILVFADGTEKIVLTDKDYSEGKSDAIARGTIVTYKVNSDGEYKLKAVKDANSAKKGTFEANGTVTTISTGFRLTNDKARITLNTADDDYVYANSKTVFVVYDKANDDYTVYTGIKDAPTIDPSKDSSSVAYSYYCKSSNMATIIYIFATNTAIEDSKNVALYLSSKSVSDLIHDEDGDYFEYNAIVDGKITTVKVADKAGAEDKAGYYSHYTVDKDGYVSSTNDYTKLNTNKIPNDGTYYLAGKGIAKTSADYTVTLDTQSGGKNLTVTVDEKAKIFYEDKDGNIAESSYKNIALDENDLVYAIIDD